MTIGVRDLARRFGPTEALKGVSFDARPGEVLGIIGPNGSGKSTLLLCMAGLAEADRGEVVASDVPIDGSELRRVLICVEDGMRPWEDQWVGWLLPFWARLHRRPLSDVPPIADALGVSALWPQRVGVLSKGQRKRVIIALGLLAAQPVVLFDEPFDGLDLRQARAATDVLRGAAAGGRTIVVSLHQLEQATRICDRLVLLDNGRVAGQGTLAELRQTTGLPDGSLEDVFLALTEDAAARA
jgi:ABC-2 type transport system ATP-binding protein